MRPDALCQRWRTRGANAPIYAEMTFDVDALIFGADTALIKMAPTAGGVGGDDVTSPNDARLIALLSAAHRRPIKRRALAHIRRAVAKCNEGDKTLALIHLALSGLAKLERPIEDARRLFVADELLKAGIAQSIVIDTLGRFAGTLDELDRRYSPDQPRVPAGNGRASGQWTSDASTSTSVTSTSQFAASEHLHQPTQVADNSPIGANSLRGTSIKPANFTPTPRSPIDRSEQSVKISCDELLQSDYAICTSVLISEDTHYQGKCMEGMLQRNKDCLAGNSLSPLLPY